jgi:hypothetical protein
VKIGEMNLNIFVIVSIAMWIALFVYWVIRARQNGILNELVGLVKLIFSGLILFVPEFVSVAFLTYKPFWLVQVS